MRSDSKLRIQILPIERKGFPSVDKNVGTDGGCIKNRTQIGRQNISYRAVRRTDYTAAFNHIVQRYVVLFQKESFLLQRFRCVLVAQTCNDGPETILRVPVKELTLPGFDRRKAPKNQETGIRSIERPKAVFQGCSFHSVSAASLP